MLSCYWREESQNTGECTYEDHTSCAIILWQGQTKFVLTSQVWPYKLQKVRFQKTKLALTMATPLCWISLYWRVYDTVQIKRSLVRCRQVCDRHQYGWQGMQHCIRRELTFQEDPCAGYCTRHYTPGISFTYPNNPTKSIALSSFHRGEK